MNKTKINNENRIFNGKDCGKPDEIPQNVWDVMTENNWEYMSEEEKEKNSADWVNIMVRFVERCGKKEIKDPLNVTAKQLKSLPKWARDYINALKNEAKEESERQWQKGYNLGREDERNSRSDLRKKERMI